jgi:N-acyl-D-amino-acid deacylase
VTDLLLRGGSVVDGGHARPRRADVLVSAGRIRAVTDPDAIDLGATDPAARGAAAMPAGAAVAGATIAGATVAGVAGPGPVEVVDCAGRLVMPGFIDTHSHADAAVFEPEVQRALLRQGITTVIAGQDGVSYAPGDGRYASEYFAALIGAHPGYTGGGVAELLASYDGRVPLNVAYLIPHGTVRHEVMGSANRAATAAELDAMRRLIVAGLAEGAVGLSTGLDYVPGLFADAAELALLCRPVADAGGVYVTHMRGYETQAGMGMDEVRAICRGSGVRAHISHLHGPAQLVLGLVDGARADGIDLTFDAYPYRAGCTLLSMAALPPDMLALGSQRAAALLREPATRHRLRETWLPGVAAQPHLGEGWTGRVTLAHVAATGYHWAAGLTIDEAARRAGLAPDELILDILAASELAVSVIMPLPPGRTVDELAEVLTHDAHMVGSDGIYVGAHPHPRGWGSFTRFLARHVRDRAELGWAQAAAHVSSSAAARFRLGRRGLVRAGHVADLVVVDPDSVADEASYRRPRTPSTGIADVLVAGVPVLRGGELTGALPGGGLRREA